MEKFLVCDGGGTKTDFLIFDKEANILGYSSKAGTNAKFIYKDKSINNVFEGINESLENAKLKLEDIESINLFIPGFEDCIKDIKIKLKYKKVNLFSDIDNAFYGALGCSKGIVALAGTGSFAVGGNSKENKVSVGGWGPLIGDKGSGYHIGILLLEKIVGFYDRDKELGYLKKLAFTELNVKDEIEMRNKIYSENFTREKVASLCKVVAKAALLNDENAIDILKEASKELVKLIDMVNERLGKENLNVSLIGGVYKIGEIFINIFKDELEKTCPNLTFLRPLYDPLIGGMLNVLERELNINLQDDAIKNNLEKYKGGILKC